MTLCKFGNVVIKSRFPLGMVEVAGVEPDYELVFPPARDQVSAANHWFHQFPDPDDKPWLSLAKQGLSYLFRFHDLIDFWVSTDGKEIRGHPAPNTPPETIVHLFLDQVMPRVLSQRGRIVLHASAVLTPKGAVAFLGDASRGKSTLTASFCQRGFPGLTDDCLLLHEDDGEHFVIPIYSGLRLWPDTISALFGNQTQYPQVAHDTNKRRLRFEHEGLRFPTDRIPLYRLYMLAPPDDLTQMRGDTIISPLSSREAIMALVNCAYRLDITDRDMLKRELRELSQLAASVGLWRLAIPRDFSLLPMAHQTILQHLEGPAPYPGRAPSV